MRYLYIISMFVSILLMTGCDLERDNILDGKNNTQLKGGVAMKFSRYTVEGDNNSDGIVNKGETVKLQVYLKNNGTKTANNVRATITCSSPYISGLSPTTATGYYDFGYNSYDYIDKGQEGYDSNNYLSFNVSSTTPAGTIITFNLSITDESNNTWTDSFTITVMGTGATVGFSKYTVKSDNNSDGIINKGEAVKLQVYLKNNGTSTANKVRATITCSNPYITGLSPATATGYFENGSSYYDYLETGKEGYGSNNYLSFNVSSITPVGTVITFNLSITDESNNTWADSFTITVVGTGAAVGFSRATVYSDNNGDGIINKGEAVKLQVYLKNNGTSTANKVRATITCSSTYITGLSSANAYYENGSSYYDYIETGKEGYYSYNYLSFNVSSTTPAGTVITFNLSITDESNNTWTDSFTITVVGTGAAVGFSRATVNSDNNGDGIINKGEAVKLQVYLKNNGTSTANKVRATITCSSTYITGLSSANAYYENGSSYYDYIETGKEGYYSYNYLSFNVSSTTPVGTLITFNLSITDESNNTWTSSFSITVH